MAKLYDAGTYRARALEGALSETGSGKPQVAVRFHLLDHGEETITWWGYFTEKTEETTLRALRTAGWTGDDLADLSELQAPSCPEVWLVVENEADQEGALRSKVRWVNKPGAGNLKSMEESKAKSFAEKMRAKVRELDKKAGAPASTSKSGDVPF